MTKYIKNTYRDEVATALAYVPAYDREMWVRMAMAVKSELGEEGFPLWDDWSKSADNYQREAAISTWKSINSLGGVTIASLFSEAKNAGWRPSSNDFLSDKNDIVELERQVATIEFEKIRENRQQAAKRKAQEDWSASMEPTANHPYIITKGIIPFGARQLKERIVLPLKIKGEIFGLQFINNQGKKFFSKGSQVKGTSMVIGTLTDATEAILCEGWATACSLHQATGLTVVVAWNAGNLASVAQRLSDTFIDMSLIVCADNDASGIGQSAARNAVFTHRSAKLSIPQFSDEHYKQAEQKGKDLPTDFNDVHFLMGLEEVKRQVLAGVAVKNINSSDIEVVGTVGIKNKNLVNTSDADGNNVFPLHEKLEEKEKKNSSFAKNSFFIFQGSPKVRDGVYWREPKIEDSDKQSAAVFLCSPLFIEAETRDETQSNWGRLLSWYDNDKHRHQWACPIEMLATSDAGEFRRELARRGLTLSQNSKARQRLVEYITTYPSNSAKRIRCVTQIGWKDSRYVMPCKVYGDQAGEDVIYQGTDISDFTQAGTLIDWQRHIAGLAVGNSRIVFAISVAFAGVLSEMAGESGGGFHFVGTTSKGKTSTLLDPAASVWGSPERYAKKWRTTVNGLEALCIGRNDGLLILDELAQVAPQEAGCAAYLIANGQSKTRMVKEGGNAPLNTWRVMLLSAGEIELSQHMAEGGKTVRGGQIVRLPSIPADAGKEMGTLEDLHHFSSGQAFADHMKSHTRLFYGKAGITFLEHLTNPEQLLEVRGAIKDGISKITEQLNVPRGCAPEVGRVAARFALVAFAGELASSYGITGWQQGQALQAVKQCFSDWLAENTTDVGKDDLALLSQISAFMQQHSFTRFPMHDASEEELARCIYKTGFRFTNRNGDIEFWVHTESFKNELCKSFNTKQAIKILLNAGWLQEGNNEQRGDKIIQRHTQKKHIRAISKSQSFYVLNDCVLNDKI